ncbi:MAG: hypothetical protein QM765_10925 [Myxococcales bacterium]
MSAGTTLSPAAAESSTRDTDSHRLRLIEPALDAADGLFRRVAQRTGEDGFGQRQQRLDRAGVADLAQGDDSLKPEVARERLLGAPFDETQQGGLRSWVADLAERGRSGACQCEIVRVGEPA